MITQAGVGVAFLLLLPALGVDAAAQSSSSCFVGVYGWTCTPSDFNSALVAYDTIVSLRTSGSSSSGSSTSKSSSSSGGTSTVSCTGSSCPADCVGACDTPCAEAKFAALFATYAGKQNYFIDPYGGDDGWDGTQTRPWHTVHRGEAQLRWSVAVVDEAPPAVPLQLWIRAEPGVNVWRPLQL